MSERVVIARRYRGFDRVAQGGYSSGLLAAHLGGPARVSLKAPVPMDEPLRVEPVEDGFALRGEAGVLAEARPAGLELEPPQRVSPTRAAEASEGFPGLRRHPFPGCFCCGPDREAGDGLRIFPGPLGCGDLLAAGWLPDPAFAGADGTVRTEVVWAAFDCPQLWALMLSSPADSTDHVVTAAMETELRGAVVAGEPYAIVVWPLGGEGRRLFAGAALLDAGGEVLGVSRQTAVLAPVGVPLGRGWMSGAGGGVAKPS
ncbi:MAG: hypothetical protein R2725_14545 [Solirubrobacterales bacterium]